MDLITCAIIKKLIKEEISNMGSGSKGQWYENIRMSTEWGPYSGGCVSDDVLPKPTKIRIENFHIGMGWDEGQSDFGEYYDSIKPYTFNITPDENGSFSVTLKAKRYDAWVWVEEFESWMPNDSSNYEEAALTLHFQYAFNKNWVLGDDANFALCTGIFCEEVGNIGSNHCTVSLYIEE